MKLFLVGIVSFFVIGAGSQNCLAMVTTEEVVARKMDQLDTVIVNGADVPAIIEQLQAFALVMKNLSQAALDAASEAAGTSDPKCSDPKVLKKMTIDSMKAAHAHTNDFFEIKNALPQSIGDFLGQGIEDLRKALLPSNQAVTVGEKLQALERYGLLSQQIILNAISTLMFDERFDEVTDHVDDES